MDGKGLVVCLVPFAGLDRGVMEHLARELEASGARTVIEGAVPVPADALNARRHQYLGRSLLTILGAFEGDRVLGVTGVDLYTPGLNFILGQAEVGGRAAIISTHRLKFLADVPTYLDRVVKEAFHELGHTLGLKHCDDVGCVMHFSNTISDTDRKGKGFCQRCTREVDRALLQLDRLRRP